MTRRRPILAACVAVVALGAAWWLMFAGLSAEEQRLVGTWRPRDKDIPLALTLMADHQFKRAFGHQSSINVTLGRWCVQGEKVYFDDDPSAIRRAFRPLLERLGIPVRRLPSNDLTRFDSDGANRDETSLVRDGGD